MTDKSVIVVSRTFGPRYSERQLELMNYADNPPPAFAAHAGCWVNGPCHDPECIMAPHTGIPVIVELPTTRIKRPRRTP